MKITVLFYRVRERDDARAVVGSEIIEAESRAVAIREAQLLARTLNMPQSADAMSLSDADGAVFHTEDLREPPIEGNV